MSLEYPLWLIDAFVGSSLAGNPAGVCFVDTFPENSIMQNIAAELSWSETAFVQKISSNKFHIRWFSPKDEAPICGHATLASAHFLWESEITKVQEILFQSPAGELKVSKDHATDEPLPWISMDFPAYAVSFCEKNDELSQLKAALGDVVIETICRDELAYLVALKSEKDVAQCQPNLDMIKSLNCRAVIITALSDNPYYDFVSRYFAPKVGILEDPVCGSAHCRLTPFWSKKLKKTNLLAHQISDRGGILKLNYDEAHNRVNIAGHTKTVLIGTIIV